MGDFYRKPVGAVAIAVGAGVLAGKANANAAKAIGVPVALFGIVLSVALMLFGLGS